jgi:fibronectin type 3 domain-containing protein
VLVAFATSAGAQDKASRPYTITVAHVVNISWTASPTPGVTYNVYVSGTSGGPYTRIGNVSVLQFADKNGVAGSTYFYVVTATNSDGESINSNEVSVTLPTP